MKFTGQHGETLAFDGVNPRLAAAISKAWDAFSQQTPSPFDAIHHFDAGYVADLEPAKIIVRNGLPSIRINNDRQFQNIFDDMPQPAIDAYAAGLTTHFGLAVRLYEWKSNSLSKVFFDRVATRLNTTIPAIHEALPLPTSEPVVMTDPEAIALRERLLAEFGDSELGDGTFFHLVLQAAQRQHGGGTGPLTIAVRRTLDDFRLYGASDRLPLQFGESGEPLVPSTFDSAFRLAAVMHDVEHRDGNSLAQDFDLARIERDDIALNIWAKANDAANLWHQSIRRPRFSASDATAVLTYNRWHKNIIDREVDALKRSRGITSPIPVQAMRGDYFGTLTPEAQALEEPAISWMPRTELIATAATDGDAAVISTQISGRHGEMFHVNGVEARFSKAFRAAIVAFDDIYPVENDALRQIVSMPLDTVDPVDVRYEPGHVVPTIAINNDGGFQQMLTEMDDAAVEAFATSLAISACVRVRLRDIDEARASDILLNTLAYRLETTPSRLSALTSEFRWLNAPFGRPTALENSPEVRRGRSALFGEFGEFERADVSLNDLIAFSVQRSFASGTGRVTAAVFAGFEDAMRSGICSYVRSDDTQTSSHEPVESLARMITVARTHAVPPSSLSSHDVPQDALDAAHEIIETWKASHPQSALDVSMAQHQLQFDHVDDARAMDTYMRWAEQSTLAPSVYQAQLPANLQRPTPTRFGERARPLHTDRNPRSQDRSARTSGAEIAKRQTPRWWPFPKRTGPAATHVKPAPGKQPRPSVSSLEQQQGEKRALPGRAQSPPKSSGPTNPSTGPSVRPPMPGRPPASPPPPSPQIRPQIKPPDNGPSQPPSAPGPPGC